MPVHESDNLFKLRADKKVTHKIIPSDHRLNVESGKYRGQISPFRTDTKAFPPANRGQERHGHNSLAGGNY